MDIVFLSGGKREKALKTLLSAGKNVVAVITPWLKESNRRFEKVVLTAIEYGVPVFPVQRYNLLSILENLSFDILISCGFTYILDQSVIDLARYAINVHPTLLPKYRGFRSGAYVLLNGEQKTGVTIHFMNNEMDKGDILLQEAYDISPFDTIKSLYSKNLELEGPMLIKALDILESGQYKAVVQDESQVSKYDYLRTPEDSFIDWNMPLKDLYNQIRACDPDEYPAFFFVEGQKVCIKLWRPDKPDEEEDMI